MEAGRRGAEGICTGLLLKGSREKRKYDSENGGVLFKSPETKRERFGD